MKSKYIVTLTFAIVLSAVVLTGTCISYWLNAQTPPKADITVEVPYVYIGLPSINSISGLGYSTFQTGTNYGLSSYVLILNVTNNGDQMFSLTQFRASVAQQIIENKIGLNDTRGNPAPGGLGGPSIEIRNPLISDTRTALQTGGFSNYLDAKESRLLALTGMFSLGSFKKQSLQNGTLWIWGSATAQPGYASGQTVWSPQSQSVNEVKQVTFQDIGGDYLYNMLLGQNQTMVIEGLDAIIMTSR